MYGQLLAVKGQLEKKEETKNGTERIELRVYDSIDPQSEATEKRLSGTGSKPDAVRPLNK